MAEPLPAKNSAPRWWDFLARKKGLLAVALLFLATIPMLTKNFTSDFGTHIAIGREIVETRSIPDKEFLNYPSLGADSRNPVWLFQAVLYLVFAAGGPYAVSFFLWAIVFGIFSFLHRSCLLRGANPVLAVIAIFAFSGFLRIRIQPRPEMFTYLFISLTIFLFSEFYFGKRNRMIYAFPVLVLAWANSHPTYLMAFLLCGIFTIDYFARAAWSRELSWKSVKTWILPPVVVAAVGLIACGWNPNGYEGVLAPLQTITRGEIGGGNPILMSISELTPVKGTGFYGYYKAAVVFAALSLVLGTVGRRVYLLDLFLFTIAFKGAWDSARAVSMMGLFLSPGASLHVTGFLERVGAWSSQVTAGKAKKATEKGKEKGKRRKPDKGKSVFLEPVAAVPSRLFSRWTAMGALIVGALAVFGGTTLSFSFSQLEYGIGLTEHKFSFAAAEFMRKNPIPGKMFNFFDIGGFLDWQIYPQALTFIDGRTYNQEVFMEHQSVTGATPGWEDILRKYNITYIVLKSVDSSGMILPVIIPLSNNPDWSLVFADGLFVIFVRNSSENREYIAKHHISKQILPRQIIAESYHYMHLGVSPLVVYQNVASMHEIMGDRQAAIDALREALSIREEPFLRGRLMQFEQGIGGGKRRSPGHP